MGVDCYNYFRNDVDVKDLTIVIGRSLGVPLVPTCVVSGTQLYRAEGVMVEPAHWESRWTATHCIGIGSIRVVLPEGHWAGETYISPFWRLTSRDIFRHRPAISMSWRSTPLRVAVSMRLGRFFGGTVWWDDTSRENHIKMARTCPVDEHGMIPHGGAEWHEFHREMYDMRPLTEGEVKECEEYALYGRD